MAEFLLEVMSEEIPARMQCNGVKALHENLQRILDKERVRAEETEVHVTPRRLVVVLQGLPERQPDLHDERKGPRVGAPDKAVEGFARSAGVAVSDLEERETDKRAIWFARIHRPGRAIAELLAEAVPQAMADLTWPKSMRWGDHSARWVRPISSIVALLDGAAVPFAFGPVSSGQTTRGHRFLAPDPFEVTGFADYRDRLRAAHVIIDHAERRAIVAEGAAKLAEAEGLTVEDSPGLLDEVAGLVEWPVPVVGGFDPAFMEMPQEVLVTEMTRHQRCFPLRDAAGALAPRFVFTANMEGGDGGRIVTAGNERVLAARLSDGRHFWDQDRKRTLESRVPDLANIVFHTKLGTVAERVVRMEMLSEALADSVPGCDAALARRAAHLAKADLPSEMVGEFPELQGVMGACYARYDGEDEAVAAAVSEHYSPQGPSDACPTAPVSIVVALAEKLDTLVGFFAIDEKPTGSRDPFALRRAALGVIRLILENRLRMPLLGAFATAREAYGEWDGAAETVGDDLLAFFADRLKVHLRDEGVGHDLIDAVFAQGADDDLVRLMARVHALQAFLATEDGANLLSAYKRAANIVSIEERKDNRAFDGAVHDGKLAQDEERAVVVALATADAASGPALSEERFEDAMTALAALRRPVDAFFDHVTVNAEDVALRENRLNLLSAIRATMDRVADFSKIEG
ncbi:MAG: glycine--tRNA ligase subunit beta [Rhodospirillales bacterium]|nr:glycine--tRNA ligase subunit beta [Rhodospirillales bacterium]